jgi:hypothetical protein
MNYSMDDEQIIYQLSLVATERSSAKKSVVLFFDNMSGSRVIGI